MTALMSNPAFLGTAPALAVSLIVTVIVLAVRKGGPGAVLMVGIGLGFLGGFVAIEALPPVVPVTAKQKLFYIAVGLLIVGVVVDRRRAAPGRLLVWLVPLLVLGWLTVRLWLGGPDLRLVLEFVALLAASGFVLGRLRRRYEMGALGPGVQLLFGAVGLSMVSLIGASASLAMLASSLAAATGGVLLFAYILSISRGRVTAFGALGWLAGGGILMTIVAITVLFAEEVNRWALVVLLGVFVVDAVRVPARLESRVVRPVVLGALALVPVAVAVGLALLLSDGGSPY